MPSKGKHTPPAPYRLISINGESHPITEKEAARIILEAAGGGYTSQSTIRAMMLQQKLTESGKVDINRELTIERSAT